MMIPHRALFVTVLAASFIPQGHAFVVHPRSSLSPLNCHVSARAAASSALTTTSTSSRLRLSGPNRATAASEEATTSMLLSSLAPLQRRGRRTRSRLEASEEGTDGVGASSEKAADATSSTSSLMNSVGDVTAPSGASSGAGGAGVDLAKGIAFEAPKSKAGDVEAEEESESKKVRVILYTVLSLVPFLLLLPFLGGRELAPLDPSQM